MALRKCSERPIFTFTDFPCYVSQSYNVIKSDRINNLFLTGLLNSKLICFWLKHKGKMQGSNYQIDNEPLSQIPICKPSDINIIKNKVNSIISKKLKNPKSDVLELEMQIDFIAYKLYTLTYNDCIIIDPEIEQVISRDDYEKATIEELAEWEFKK